MSDISTKNTPLAKKVAFGFTHAGSLMIGVNCFINAYVLMGLAPFAPITGIIAASCGFFLNYILYVLDYNIAYDLYLDIKKNGISSFFKPEYLISALSGLIMSLFTYANWQTMIVDHNLGTIIPAYFPLLFSIAYFIGTAVLLGSTMIGKVDPETNERLNWIQTLKTSLLAVKTAWNNKNYKQFLQLIVSYAIASICIISTVMMAYLPEATKILAQFPSWISPLFYLMVLSIFLSEFTFNLKNMGQTFGVKYEKSPSFKFSLSAIPIFLIIFCNAIGNGYIALGTSSLTSRALEYLILCSGIMTSCVVMFICNMNQKGNLSFSVFGDTLKAINSSELIVSATWGLAAFAFCIHSLNIPLASFIAVATSAGSFALTKFLTAEPKKSETDVKALAQTIPASDLNQNARLVNAFQSNLYRNGIENDHTYRAEQPSN